MSLKLQSRLVALALFASVHHATAQGTAFSYSGQLQVSGIPVTGLYDFQFSLSNAPSGGGSQVGNTVAVSALGVTNGLFSTTMDFGPVFSNSPTWLAIGVRPTGGLSFTNLTPLQQILPTPYAIYAETAGYATVLANGVALGTGQANAIDPSAGNSFIGGGFGNNIGAGSTTVTVGGGTLNYATGQYVTVGGGQANRATNDEATVGGGSSNNAGGPGTTVAGGQDNYASGQFAAVGGGYQNNASGFMATISGGQGNQATDQYTTIGGGDANTASVEYGTVGGGVDNTALGYGTVGGGQGNTAGAYNGTVGGGENNLASGYAAVVSGGEQNSASGPHAVVGGGNANFATNVFATVPGGLDNVAGGPYSFAAGFTAQATNDGAFVWSDDEGGLPFTSTNNNSFNVRANGGVRFMTGGAGMTIDGQTVLTGSGTGGQGNPTFSSTVTAPNFVSDASGDFIAGNNNTAGGGYETVGGGYLNTVSAEYGTVGGGINNQVFGIYATVGGGQGNQSLGDGGFIGGGGYDSGGLASASGNHIESGADDATIGGGLANLIDANAIFAAIGGGVENQVLGPGGFIGGGGLSGGFGLDGNTIGEATSATIGGGAGNTIDGAADYATIGGGANNTASADYSTVPGGFANVASGLYSYAAGNQAKAANQGAFVWADSQNANFTSTAHDQFLIRAQGGVGINTTSPQQTLSVAGKMNVDGNVGIGTNNPTVLLQLRSGASANYNLFEIDSSSSGVVESVFSVDGSGNVNASGQVSANGVQLTSDRNVKENFATLDNQAVLAKVAALPLSEWNYKTDSKSVQHIGPMAQDFHAAFGLDGADDKHISVVDEGGVALAAIQGLNQKLEETRVESKAKDAEIAALKRKNEAFAAQLQELATAVKVLAGKK